MTLPKIILAAFLIPAWSITFQPGLALADQLSVGNSPAIAGVVVLQYDANPMVNSNANLLGISTGIAIGQQDAVAGYFVENSEHRQLLGSFAASSSQPIDDANIIVPLGSNVTRGIIKSSQSPEQP
ncbi:hypothetical protein GS597_03195 [Synechococcales cyanobacterium C]|uniref:Uncharacterized protein n=1 Tax=Petrachloros mirabilis ULC683 TaxID=2781853 RepID=A0A8K1ZX76_9CYAN|nr:hypothetical protein [Petrachloros mirabilis]NCJ05528.1 hypothetical protein [Petrachloros mirabilis ULC683]